MDDSEALKPAARSAAPARHRHRKKRLFVVHPILFAALPVLVLWAGNIQEGIALRDALLPLAAVVGGAAVVFFVATLILKSAAKAGLVTSVLILALFTYGLVYSAVNDVEVGGLDLGRHLVLLPVWGILGLGLVVLAGRARRFLPEITTILNVMAIGLVALNTWSVVSFQLQEKASEEDAARLSQAGFVGTLPDPQEVLAQNGSNLRDIYYIVFDTYGGEKTMRDIFNFDNVPFLRQLEDRGFFVGHQATTNYPRTSLSLASSLNMEYLGFLTEKYGANTDDATPLTNLIQYNRVGRFLQSIGYRYYQIGSWWGPTVRNPMADENLKFGGPSEFVQRLTETTVLQEVSDNAFRNREYNRVPYQFAAVPRTEELEGPRFVFVHVLCPHGPFVFNADGSYVSKEDALARGRAVSYVNQVRYVNSQVVKMVDGLLDRPADQQPIIIIQADEGPYEGAPSTWIPRPSRELDRKFPIIAAYYLPGKGDGGLPQDLTPVNTFRVVFNLYFGADLEILPSRNYVFRSLNRLYDFTDVTDLVRDIFDRPPP
jgi:hypothetical protein